MATARLAIDLGTANTVVILQGKGVVIQEPTVVAVSISEKKLVAVGNEAKEILGKEPKDIEARRPLKMGSIANYRMTEALLKKFINKSIGNFRLFKPEVIISVPVGITSVEERAVLQALNASGVGKVYLLPEPIAAAIGAGMPIHTSNANMIINMGGGTSEIAILSMNGIVSSASEKIAGDAISDAIIDYFKKKKSILIGENMAEQVKINIVSAIELEDPLTMEVRGRNTKTGLPDFVIANTNELVPVVREVLHKILRAVHKVLEKTPPELASDIIDKGIVLSGGTSLLRNIDVLFTRALSVPAHVVEDPLFAVVKGLEIAIDNIEQFRRSLK